MRGGGVIRRHIACDAGGGGEGVIRRHIVCDVGVCVIRRHIVCDVGGGGCYKTPYSV